jgi:bifunctional UDP-N-acetylglucosamine pyrophosphorylase / glucosamine-1-phosphate N-acetyltransferase
MTSQTRARAAIILAAGQGTRMKSPLPKVLHPVGGRAMLDHAIDAAEALGCQRIVVVVGTHSPEVRAHVVRRLGEDAVAIQDPPLGTGHAVRAAEQVLAGFDGEVIVTYGDVPLLKAADIEPVFNTDGVTVIGFEARDPGAYGRLILEGETLVAITEAKEASPEVLAVTACNSGVMAAPAALLFSLLADVTNDNAKGEYYLTDVVGLARKAGHSTRAVFAAEDGGHGRQFPGRTGPGRGGLFQRGRSATTFMAAGVTMAAPDTVHFAWDTQIGGGTVIEQFVVFGPGAVIEGGARDPPSAMWRATVVAGGAEVGPYARLRPGADLAKGVKIGNFVEVKNVKMAEGAKANHLAYLGDGSVGAGANIGAGTIFCNYDGFNKARDPGRQAGAFVGSNSSPGGAGHDRRRRHVASGSVITEDVPADALAFGRARQVIKTERGREAFRAEAKAAKEKGKKPTS